MSSISTTGNSYAYDCNGNVTSRTVGGNTYTLTYDAENRLVGVTSGGTTASFVYDGDGNRVSGTINSVTTSYIGNYFEWTGSASTMVNYYYAGSARIAERQGAGAAQYFLDDHLGSTSLTVDASGNMTAELRYKAWGETRYTNGSTPTTYKYTGQKQEASLGGLDGLYYYNARWYDPALGRFIQSDTIVPGSANPQTWDRYAYCLDNPIRLVDPTGHVGTQTVYQIHDAGSDPDMWEILADYGISIVDPEKWSLEDVAVLTQAIYDTGNKLATLTGGTGSSSFRTIFGGYRFSMGCSEEDCGTAGGMHVGGSKLIEFNALSSYFDSARNNIIHELGHAFDFLTGISGSLDTALNLNDDLGNHITGAVNGRGFVRSDLGYKTGPYSPYPYEQHPFDNSQASDSQWNKDYNTAVEDFGDMFLNWVEGTFDFSSSANNAGYVRNDWMQTNMAEFLH